MVNISQFLTRSGFAASQGWSPSYVTKLSQQGRLVMSPDGKMVDVAATLDVLKKTQDPGKDHVTRLHAAGRTERHVTALVRPDAPADEKASTGADPKYWENKARRESALATMAELELAERSSQLVSRERVEAMAFATGRMLRDAILGLPTRLAPELAAMTDSFEIENRMRKELRQVLESMAKAAADDLAASMQRQ